MKIQILGMACPECDQVFEHAAEALTQMGIDAEIEMVNDPETIKGMGVYVTPALAIDGEVKVAGQVLSVEQIKAYLSQHGK
jgi:small redox-active disulfide protein 2